LDERGERRSPQQSGAILLRSELLKMDSTIDSITIIDCIAFAAIITVIAVTSAVNTVTDLDHSA